ncbi:MAG: hypothetical protein ACI4VP_05825 [Clostridia bacterium]
MKMTIKMLHMDAKKNMTTEEVIHKYGFDTAQDFFKAVERISNAGKTRELKGIFAHNDKIARKTLINASVPAIVETPTDVNLQEDAFEEAGSQEQKQKPSSIDILREQESLLSGEVINLEKKHKKLAEVRMGIRRDVASLDTVLEELKKLVEENFKKLEDFEAQYDKTAERMAEVSFEIASKRDQLEKLREQIEILSSVTIFVYEDGNVEVENGEFVFDETQAKLYFEDLLQKPEAEEVTIKVIRTIAKIKAMGGEPTVVFESEKARTLFEAE